VLLELFPALGGHPLGPGAVVPELGVLVDVGDDPGRATFFFEYFAAAHVHRVVQGIALGGDTGGAAGALVPILAVFLLERCSRAADGMAVFAKKDVVDAICALHRSRVGRRHRATVAAVPAGHVRRSVADRRVVIIPEVVDGEFPITADDVLLHTADDFHVA